MVWSIGLEAAAYGAQSMRHMKTTQIYKENSYLRAVQFLLAYAKMKSTLRNLGAEPEDAPDNKTECLSTEPQKVQFM